MLKKLTALLLTIATALSFASCGSEKKRYEAEFLLLFDTVTTIVGYADSKEEFTEFSQLIYDELKEYHELYDIYNSYDGVNNLKTINDNAGNVPVKVDKRIIEMLTFAKEKYTQTGGKCNVAFGAVLEIWHLHRTQGIDDPENATLPSMAELEEAAKHTDINNLIIDEAASTVYLADPDMSLDVGAVAKGYATEQVCLFAMEQGYIGALVSVGGNVRAIGSKNGAPWNVGIQNPDTVSDKTMLHVVYLEGSSMVTSGDYERYFTVDGKRYHHIIDPNTLYPADYFTAVTMLCDDSGMADVLSTAVFCMPFEDGKKLIEEMAGTEAMWVLKDGEIRYSTGFEAKIKS